jgi:hypothetical protein
VDELTLLDWKRRIFALYAEVRAADDPESAWQRWCTVRGDLYRTHPQSPRVGGEPAYFPYDTDLRFEAYGGGVFLPFRDETSWRETYGAGRGELLPS